MIKSRNGKVSIKGNGGEVVLDLCVAALGVRDTIAETVGSEKETSQFILLNIAKFLGVKVEFKKTGDNDA